MIVSDHHRFIFVHIPKCAGTSVRRALAPYDDTGGRFNAKVTDHPAFGRIDLTHMPPDLLQQVEPEIYAKLMRPDYAAYAVLRDPYERFPSSVAQRIKMFRGDEITQLSNADLHAEIDAAIAHVSAHPDGIDPTYIHFHRQSGFVYQKGRQVVDRLYAIDQLPAMMADIATRTGEAPHEVRKVNHSEAMRLPFLRRPARMASDLAQAVLPRRMATQLRRNARKMLLQDLHLRTPPAFNSAEVHAFIAEHYAMDIALHQRSASGDIAGLLA